MVWGGRGALALWLFASLLNLACNGEERAASSASRLQAGRAALSQGEARRAASLLARVVKESPRNEEAHLLYSRALAASGRLRTAEQALARALGLLPRSARLWKALGDVRQRRSRYDAAVRAYERARALAPDDAEVPLALGALYERQDRPHVAAGHYEQAARARRRDVQVRALLGLARLARRSGRTRDALAHLRAAARIAPARRDVRLRLAEGMLEVGAPAAAIRVLESIRAAAGKGADVARLLGRAHQALGQHGRAVRWLRRAVQQDPEDAESWRRLARSLFARGDAEAGYRAGVKALAFRPNDLEAAWLMIPAYLKRGLVEPARRLLDRVASVRAHDGDYWRYRARVAEAEGAHGQAYEAWTRALTLLPRRGRLRCLAGGAARRAGRYRAAVRHLRACLALGDLDSSLRYDALVHLGIAREVLGDRAGALRHLATAARLLPERAEAVTYQAWIALRRGALRQAVSLARSADRLARGRSPHALDVLAAALERLGRRGEARVVLDRAQKLPLSPADRGYLAQRRKSLGAPPAAAGGAAGPAVRRVGGSAEPPASRAGSSESTRRRRPLGVKVSPKSAR